AWVGRRESLGWTALWLLALGTASGAVAAGTGLYASKGVMVDPTVRDELLGRHQLWMVSTVGLGVVLTLWAAAARPFPLRGRRAFLLFLVVLVAVMAHGADYGGRLVYDYNAGGDACGQPIEFTK